MSFGDELASYTVTFVVLPVFIVGSSLSYFFFQAEDGIRDTSVTGVQTCALPIFFLSLSLSFSLSLSYAFDVFDFRMDFSLFLSQIGRASCRERV